jgi:dihydrolipoamide dehydrogenase
VVLFEERALGGVCLNEGCIPTKTFLHAAKYGAPDHAETLKRKAKVVQTLTGGVGAAMKAAGVTVVKARGQIAGRSGDGYAVAADGQTHTGKRLLIATGSAPFLPPIPGLAEALASGLAVTSREALELKTVPKCLVVVGGGVIGLEMAQYFHAAGSDVAVLEMLPAIGGGLDHEIAAALLKALRDKGLRIITEAKVTGVGDTVLSVPSVTYEQGGQSHTLEADKVLLSLGRRPVLAGLGLETLPLESSPHGIPTDKHQQTNLPGLYAAGDVTGKMLLAHVAYRQAEAAVAHMLGKRDDPIRYDAVPAVLYTHPEAALAGLTEAAAKEQGYHYAAVTLPMVYSGRFVAEAEPGAPGLCKIVAEKGSGRLLGIHVLGPYASEIITAAAVLLETGATTERAKRVVFPHPTVGEMIRECLWKLEV